MMDVEPALTPVATPELLTVATAVAVEVQVTARPVMMPPAESRNVAVKACVAPTLIDAVAGVSVRDATGTRMTVRADVSLCPPLDAMMDAEPTLTPVATPELLTVATVVAVELHVTARPVMMPPAESRNVAVKAWVAPTLIVALAGVRVRDATGTIATVTVAGSLCQPLVATPVLVDVHETERPVKMPPAESYRVTVNDAGAPSSTVAVGGVTVTDATGGGVTTITAVSATPEVSTANTLSCPGVGPALKWPTARPRLGFVTPVIWPPVVPRTLKLIDSGTMSPA